MPFRSGTQSSVRVAPRETKRAVNEPSGEVRVTRWKGFEGKFDFEVVAEVEEDWEWDGEGERDEGVGRGLEMKEGHDCATK
jgi:hypothetical protein